LGGLAQLARGEVSLRRENARVLAWFFGLWVAGVVALAMVAGALRLAMSAAGY